LEVTPFEQGGGMHEIGSSRFSEYRRVYRICAIFATQPNFDILTSGKTVVKEDPDGDIAIP